MQAPVYRVRCRWVCAFGAREGVRSGSMDIETVPRRADVRERFVEAAPGKAGIPSTKADRPLDRTRRQPPCACCHGCCAGWLRDHSPPVIGLARRKVNAGCSSRLPYVAAPSCARHRRRPHCLPHRSSATWADRSPRCWGHSELTWSPGQCLRGAQAQPAAL